MMIKNTIKRNIKDNQNCLKKTILIILLFMNINLYSQNHIVVKESGDTIRFSIRDLRGHRDRFEDGKIVKYYDNGKLKLEAWQKSGHFKGMYILYYSNGIKKEEGMMMGSRKIGMWIYYTKSGDVKEKGCYLNDLREGLWEIYNDKGDIVSKHFYNAGQLIKNKDDP